VITMLVLLMRMVMTMLIDMTFERLLIIVSTMATSLVRKLIMVIEVASWKCG
jgi:hypothetical protein